MTANVVPISAAQSHDAAAGLEALAITFGGRPWQATAIDPATGAEASATFTPHDRQGVTAWLAEHAAWNIYFGHAERKTGATQRRKVDIAAVHWLHVDIDPRPDEPLDAERARIRASLDNPPGGIPKPSLVIDSGRGFVASWQLAEPLCDLAAAEAANRWLAEQLGGDKCHDVSRILRLPGTVNCKPEAQGRRARIVSHDAGAVYTFDLFGRSERRERQEPDATPIGGELNRPEDIAAGIAICLSAAPAIEGQAGRTAAFTVGMLLKRSGVSLERAQDLAVDYYDPRCSPPDEDWMRERIERGWLDGEGRPGCDRPEVLVANAFAGIVVPEPVYMNGGGTTSTTRVRFLADTSALAQVAWLCKGWLPREGVVLLAGQSRIGKTFLLLELAGALATGGSFFGRSVRERVGVLILAAEGAGTIAPRLEALRLHRLGGIDAATLPIAWAEISDANEIGAIVTAAAAEMQRRFGLRLGMIGVDTVAAAFNADENDAQLATAAMKALGKLASEARTLVVAVAHYGKSDGAGVRGSSAWTASADVILAATGEISEISGEVKDRKVALTKSRYAETGPISDFELRSVNLGLDEDGDPITAAVISTVSGSVAMHAHQALYMDRFDTLLLAAAEKVPGGRQGVRRELIRQYCYEEWTDATPKNRKQWFERAEKALLKQRSIERVVAATGEDFVVLPPPVDPASLF
ncbi:MAG: AAA family ATPase [Erythrobacter sp.]